MNRLAFRPGNPARITQYLSLLLLPILLAGGAFWPAGNVRAQDKPAKKASTPQKKSTRDDSAFTPAPNDRTTFYRRGELEINAFAIWAIGDAQETVTHERTVKDTHTVTRDRTVQRTELVDIPGIPGLTEVTRDVVGPAKVKESFRRTEHTSENVGPFDDYAFGLGIDAKYFVTQYLAPGVEMNWLGGDHSTLTFLATGTLRFPIPGPQNLAPYLTGGLGVQCADTDRMVGFVGVGLMKRFSSRCGAFVEARYRFDGDEENVCEIRTGVSISLGHTDETPGQPVEVERVRRGTSSNDWNQIDPIAKDLRR